MMARIFTQKMVAEIDGESGTGQYECVYGAMPRFGLAEAGRHVQMSGVRDSARGRIGATAPAGS
jgi:hypothetical protein